MAAAGVDPRIERYAQLAVQVGANVQPGQLVEVLGRVEHAEVARAVARAAYSAAAVENPMSSGSVTRYS